MRFEAEIYSSPQTADRIKAFLTKEHTILTNSLPFVIVFIWKQSFPIVLIESAKLRTTIGTATTCLRKKNNLLLMSSLLTRQQSYYAVFPLQALR